MHFDRRSRWVVVTAILITLVSAASARADGGGSWFHLNPDQLTQLSPAAQIGWIVACTLISEDAVCVLIGVLIANHRIDWRIGGLGCFVGIYVGDLLFFLLGRFGGQRLMRLKFFSRGVGPERLASYGDWFDKRPWAAIAMCRILPGLRVPLYLAVGGLTKRTAAFFFWTALFAFVWTPALIALVAWLGEAVTRPLESLMGSLGWAMLLAVVAIYLIVRLTVLLSTPSGRLTLANRFGFLWGRRRSPAPETKGVKAEKSAEALEPS